MCVACWLQRRWWQDDLCLVVTCYKYMSIQSCYMYIHTYIDLYLFLYIQANMHIHTHTYILCMHTCIYSVEGFFNQFWYSVIQDGFCDICLFFLLYRFYVSCNRCYQNGSLGDVHINDWSVYLYIEKEATSVWLRDVFVLFQLLERSWVSLVFTVLGHSAGFYCIPSAFSVTALFESAEGVLRGQTLCCWLGQDERE